MTLIKATSKNPAKKKYHHGDLAAELLNAAEKQLSENGIEAFSLRAVAKRAGVSHGAPAHHFKDVRGLLTALAAIGFERFVETQNNRQKLAKPDTKSQLVASGLGYIDFAMKNPAFFRLMFSSEIPNRSAPNFSFAANIALDKLVADSRSYLNTDKVTIKDVMAGWAIVHGLADLIMTGRMDKHMGFDQMTHVERDKVLASIILKTIKENKES